MITSSSLRQLIRDVSDPAALRTVADLQDLTDRAIDRGVPALPALHLSEEAP